MAFRRGSEPISVLLVFADGLTARLLANDLRRNQQLRVAECGPEASSVIAAISESSPDVVLASARLPGGGIPLLKQIRRSSPRTRAIVLLEESQQRQLIVELFRAGAKGVFDRSKYDVKALCRCLRCVAAGQAWANSEQIGLILDAFAETASLKIVNADGEGLLTRREKDVVRLVAEGLGNREVAEQLALSEHTVKNYLFSVFDKLGISSRAELVMYAMSHSHNKIPPGAATEEPEASDAIEGLKQSLRRPRPSPRARLILQWAAILGFTAIHICAQLLQDITPAMRG